MKNKEYYENFIKELEDKEDEIVDRTIEMIKSKIFGTYGVKTDLYVETDEEGNIIDIFENEYVGNYCYYDNPYYYCIYGCRTEDVFSESDYDEYCEICEEEGIESTEEDYISEIDFEWFEDEVLINLENLKENLKEEIKELEILK